MPADWLNPHVDKAGPPMDYASQPANKASLFGPYIFSELFPSFYLSISPFACMSKKRE